MFDMSVGEMILLAAIILIAVGPKQLPEVARTIGRLMNEFKRATGDFSRTIMDARDSITAQATETARPADTAQVAHEASAAPAQPPRPTAGPTAASSGSDTATATVEQPTIQPAHNAVPVVKKES